MNKKILITGKMCSGKTTLTKSFIKKGLTPIIQFTTRKIRPSEIPGLEYNFIKKEDEFSFLYKTSFITKYTYGNNTTYGITKENWDKGDFIALGINELKIINKEILKNCIIIYLDIPDQILKERLKKRGDYSLNKEEVERRLQSDIRDYKDFNFWDIRINDPKLLNNNL